MTLTTEYIERHMAGGYCRCEFADGTAQWSQWLHDDMIESRSDQATSGGDGNEIGDTWDGIAKAWQASF